MSEQQEPAPRRGEGRVPPHNIEAEESLLGAMMLSRDAIHAADAMVTADDFYKPLHTMVFHAIVLTYQDGSSVDPVTVSDTLRRSGELDKIGGRRGLLRLQAATPMSANAAHYAKIVATCAALRRGIRLAGDLAELAYDDSGDDPVGRLSLLAQGIVDRIGVPNQAVEPGIDAHDLAAMEFDYKFIVPGLIQRRDRVILTGLEGHSGKTEFLVQCAVQFASGFHPWTRVQEFEPLRVLYVDCENRLDQLQPRIRRLLKVAAAQLPRGGLTIRTVDEINVRTPRGAGLLDALCERHQPDVLIAGPLYAMFQGSRGLLKHSEEVAEEVAAYFRRLIARHDCALMLEAHAPHGTDGDRANLRPIGASLWLRWPEIGVGLAPMKKRDPTSKKLVVVPGKFTFDFWRGTRDQDLRRPWPSGVQRWNDWAFIPIDDSEVF